MAGDELQEFNLQPVRAVNTAMTPPKERVQNVLAWWEEGVFPNEVKLPRMIEEDRLDDSPKLLVVSTIHLSLTTLPSGSGNASAVVMGHTHPPHSVSLLPGFIVGVNPSKVI